MGSAANILHPFVGDREATRCNLRNCGLGRSASIHRKAETFPQARLEASEKKIKRISTVLAFTEERCAVLEKCIRVLTQAVGATWSQRVLIEGTKAEILEALEAFNGKWAAKARR